VAAEQTRTQTARATTALTMTALVVIGAVYLVYVWDRFVFSVELVEISRELELPLGSASLLASVFTFGLAIVAIPAGFVVYKFDTRATLVAGAVLFSLATGYVAIGHGVADILVFRVVTGVGEGLFNVALFTYLGSLSGRLRGTSVGLGASLFGIGALTGPLLVAGLLSGTGSWRVPFVALAVLGLLGAAAILLVTRRHGDAPRQRRQLDLRALRRPDLAAVAVLMACNGLGLYGVVALYNTYLRTEQGFPLGTASVLLGLNGGGQIAGGVLLGYLADRIGRRRYLAIAAACAAALGAALFLEPPSLPLCAVTAFGFGAASNSIYTNCYALVQDQVDPAQAPVVVGGLATIYFLLAAGSGPALVAAKDLLGWHAGGAAVYAAAYAVGFAAILTMKNRSVHAA
jgi:MFS family permease